MGKTFALRCFSQSLNPNLYQLSYICLSTVNVTEFYQQFCHELGLEYGFKKSVMFRNMPDALKKETVYSTASFLNSYF
jgi:hypothetical protein